MSLAFLGRWQLSHIGRRMLAFNLLVVFVPVVGVLYLDVYEKHLRDAQERGMVQQARILAAALAEDPTPDRTTLERTFGRMERRTDARFRVYDARGAIVADSVHVTAVQPDHDAEHDAAARAGSTVRDRVLYRVGARISRVWERIAERVLARMRPEHSGPAGSDTGRDEIPPEVRSALAGRYGAETRRTAGQRSVTMFVAVPVRYGGSVTGAVVVSQSTFRILRALYDVRLRVFEVVVASLVAAFALTVLAATTIVGPLAKLQQRATAMAQRRGPPPAGFPGTSRSDEIGDLARALEELTRRTSDHIQLVQSFSADVAHELKNPLASIRTAAEMMATASSEEDRRRFLDLMTRDVDRLERLVSGLRQVAVVEGQIEQEATGAVDLAVLVSGIIDAVNATSQRGVHARLTCDGTPPIVRASRERLEQALENLISNAISFAPDGTGIDVSIERRDAQCAIAIEDRGPGIPDAHLERVFDRFFSYRPAEGRRSHVGLGLAIARQIVEGYGGSISASNREGGGARFEVRLPSISSRSGVISA